MVNQYIAKRERRRLSKTHPAWNRKAVIAIDKEGNQTQYESQMAAAKALNIQVSGVSRVRDTEQWYEGYQFKTYKNERT